MYAHLCKGYAPQSGTIEIMLPYAGIIRIRFMGMISASALRGTPAICHGRSDRSSLLFLYDVNLVNLWPVLSCKVQSPRLRIVCYTVQDVGIICMQFFR